MNSEIQNILNSLEERIKNHGPPQTMVSQTTSHRGIEEVFIAHSGWLKENEPGAVEEKLMRRVFEKYGLNYDENKKDISRAPITIQYARFVLEKTGDTYQIYKENLRTFRRMFRKGGGSIWRSKRSDRPKREVIYKRTRQEIGINYSQEEIDNLVRSALISAAMGHAYWGERYWRGEEYGLPTKTFDAWFLQRPPHAPFLQTPQPISHRLKK
jgi:hypothetical protein